ncbi:retrovirus-related pol polyprotein from transposon TNT 1-94 [Tanacetum coccineum]
MAMKPKLDADLSGEPVDQTDYRTIHMGLWYLKGSGFELTAFSDADHAGCVDTYKSTSGGIQFLGDKLVSWMSKKTEYQLADMFTKALPEERFQYLVRRIGMRCLTPAELEVIKLVAGMSKEAGCTAMSSAEAEYVALSASYAQHSRTKHILTRYHFIMEQVENGHKLVNKSPTLYPCDSARTFRVILFSIHNDEWKSFQCHHQTALRRPYALSWKPCQGDSLNLPDHRIHKDGDGDRPHSSRSRHSFTLWLMLKLQRHSRSIRFKNRES